LIFDIHQAAASMSLDVSNLDATTVERMPTIMDLNFLPDMGRMNEYELVVGRKNYLFLGSDAGGARAATMYSLLGTAKLNGLNPETYLAYVFEHIADHPVNRVDELLPWNVQP